MKYITLKYKFIFLMLFMSIVFTNNRVSYFISESMAVTSTKTGYDDYDDYDDYGDEYENKNTETISDPLEKFNRKMFDFNMYMLDNIGEPVAKSYRFFPKIF